MVTIQLRVIYGDTDQMGVVYYANYLRFFEAARNEFIRAKGLRYRDFEERFGLLLPVIEAHAAYKVPAKYDDLLTIEISLGEVKRASARFDYRILRDDTLLVTGHTVHACMELSGRPRRFPAELLAALSAGEEIRSLSPTGGEGQGEGADPRPLRGLASGTIRTSGNHG